MFSTGAVPGSANVTRCTVNPAALSTPSITPSAPASVGVTDGQRRRSRARAAGSAFGGLIAAALPGAMRSRQRVLPRAALCRRAQGIRAKSVGASRAAQATEFYEGPDGDGEADHVQDKECHVIHLVARTAQNSG